MSRRAAVRITENFQRNLEDIRNLLLYALTDDRIHLLAIKHHRQLSFDLKGLWHR